MEGRFHKAIFELLLAEAVAGPVGLGYAQVVEPERVLRTDVAARVGFGGGAEMAPHLRAEYAIGPVRLDFDYGANAIASTTSWVQKYFEPCPPPKCAEYQYIFADRKISQTSVAPGRMLRFGVGFLANEFLSLGARAISASSDAEPHVDGAAWLEVGPTAMRVYAGVNDGGLVALPLQGPRLGLHSSFAWRHLVARTELAAGWGLRPTQSDWLGQGAVVLGYQPVNGFSAELAIGGASTGIEHYLQAAVGLRWAGQWDPVTETAPPRRGQVQPYREVLADADAAHWLGRETTWLHRPTGLAQTCTVTEAVERSAMVWLYQTCTPGPADAAVPWSTGCYVVDADGLWRLPVCPGEAPGRLTRPVLLVPKWGNADARFADLHDATWQQRTLKLAGKNLQAECQRVPGLQVYEACSSAAEGLLFASVRAALASDRKRWPARSTELVSLRKVVVPAGNAHFGEEVSQCHWSSACRVLGECSSAGNRCVAASNLDCGAAAVCAIRGACGEAQGRCAATAAAMCEASDNCRRLGQCQLGKAAGAPACVAADDSVCQAAEVCAEQGFCRAERGRCVAGGERPGEGLPQEASPTGVGR